MRHAYLIVAHTDFEILEKLLSILDCNGNDIFVHIDKKVCYNVKYLPKFSNIRTIPNEERIDVRWGTDSIIHCELALYKYAAQCGPYDYYHLLSGIDLPIKSQHYIHAFFEEHKGTEFIGLMQNAWRTKKKMMYYHFFISRPYPKTWKYFAQVGLVALQQLLFIKRNDMGWKILAKGTTWSSLTHAAVMYILSHEEMIKKRFRHTMACDEVYKQTLLMNSPFADSLYCKTDEYEGCMRLVDWKRGDPYVWTMTDFDEIMKSDKLFARKFSSAHMDLVNAIVAVVKSDK